MKVPRDHARSAAGASSDAGLVKPASGWFAWLGDRQVLAALAAAVPVWAALGSLAGNRLHQPIGWQAWLGFVVLQPAIEELVFRGLLQGWLLRRTAARRAGPVTQANLVTSAAFVALHLPSQPAVWALAVLAPSLVFGHLRDRLGSVLPCFVVHATYNAGFAAVAGWSHG